MKKTWSLALALLMTLNLLSANLVYAEEADTSHATEVIDEVAPEKDADTLETNVTDDETVEKTNIENEGDVEEATPSFNDGEISLYGGGVDNTYDYAKKVTFIGQWTNESSQLVDTEKTFSSKTDKLGKPVSNPGLLKGLAKTFLGWSDKPAVENGKLAPGARIFSYEDSIETVFGEGIPDDAKLYGVYYSLNDPNSPFTQWDIFSMMSSIKDLPVSDNKVTINKTVSSEDVLPNTSLSKVDNDGTIIDGYRKKDDITDINEVILEAEFEMDPTVAMLAYKNPYGSNAIRPILSYDYNERYQKDNFSAEDGQNGYTYVDLNVDLDPELTIPEIIYLEFEGYSWRPLYVLDEARNKLEIINPKSGESLGNTSASFASLVSNNDPKVAFAVKANGNSKLTVRVVLREGTNEKIDEANIIPNDGGTIAEKILENMKLRVLSKKVIKEIMPEKNEEELATMVVKVKDEIASTIAKTQGEKKLKITGSVKGNVVASAGMISVPIFGAIPLKYEGEIEETKANVVKISYTKEKTSFKVEKKWIGDAIDTITVILFANGEEIGRQNINQESDWKYEFTNLDKYDEDGAEIIYAIKEVPLEGYETYINGDLENGFVITNKKIEKVSPTPTPSNPSGNNPAKVNQVKVPNTGVKHRILVSDSALLLPAMIIGLSGLAIAMYVILKKKH